MDNIITRPLVHILLLFITSPLSATGNSETYDILMASYMHRVHPMSQELVQLPLLSYTEHRTQMPSQQSPLLSPPLQGWPIDRDYLRFQLSATMSALDFSEFYREKGPSYNLISLYATHNGPLSRLQTNSAVRSAIINELRRDHVRNNYDDDIDVISNDLFRPREFRCLLQAVLGGTLLPSQYAGRMLPFGLIGFLRS
jgi:hypothetical protein